MTRDQCKEWFKDRYPRRKLTRSACVGCPFRDSSSWLEIRDSDPELYREAAEIDALLRSPEHNAGRMFRKIAYLHPRRIPLMEAIDLDLHGKDTNGFFNECEGHCGL